MTTVEQLFSDIYIKFTDLFHQVQVREDQPEVRVPEKTIRCIWNDQIFNTHKLRTTEGADLEIIFPGYWNFGNGPDFKSAAIRVDGKTYEGDVEIHVYSSDWKAHGHSDNPDFDKVILHVFLWQGKGKPAGRRGRKPEKSGAHPQTPFFELELKKYLTKGILELNDELDFDHYPVLNQFNYGRCHKPLARLSQERLAALLNAAGDARIFTKMERFHDSILIQGYEQTFYEGVAEALGYPANKQPFQTLAQTLTLATLKDLLPAKAGQAERVRHLQALLFGVAGLIDFRSLDVSTLPAKEANYFKNLHRLWGKYRTRAPAPSLNVKDWKFGGMRPANSPYRRIAALAHLLVRHEKTGMFADYMKEFKSGISISGDKGYTINRKSTKKANDFFCVEAPDYWADHYAPGGKKLPQTQQLIGPARSREITVNIVIPIGLIYARSSKSVELESALNALFQTGKGASDNKLMRFMRHYIFGNNEEMIKVLANDKQVQGLMQVYQDFCTQNENNCLRCQFPDVVNRYFS